MLIRLRKLITLFAILLVGVVATVNVEVLVASRGWDLYLLTAFPAMIDLLKSAWVIAPLIFLVGASCGIWLQWSINKHEKAASDAEQGPPPDWREAFRKRENLRLYEVAGLLADAPPQREITDFRARAYFERIKIAICAGEIAHDFGEPPPQARLSAALNGGNAIERWREDQITPDTIIRRAVLVRHFKKARDPQSLMRLGAAPA